MEDQQHVAAPRRTFHDKVAQKEPGIVTYGLTPPKVATAEERLAVLAETQSARLRALDVDAVVLYDIHDEKDRTPNSPRPFPFAATLDGLVWASRLSGVPHPFVHFRCIAKYDADEFVSQVSQRIDAKQAAVVVVGGSASTQALNFTMTDAYHICRRVAPNTLLGAVAIAERHASKGDEHLRMLKKQTEGGVSFFITQCVYNLEEAKNLLSDYHLRCKEKGVAMAPILVTMTPCGSAKTLEFLRWLGVKVSKWLENDLVSADAEGAILEESVDALIQLFRDLHAFARRKGIPLGCNVESVAIRKAEIDAAGRLVKEVRRILLSEDSPIA